MRYGSLCSGIGGLDLAVEEVFEATSAWFCEADPHAASVLERHWPNVPILPDLKTQDWSTVEPVELVAAGYPCQPFSHAGRRQGTDDPGISGLSSSPPFAFFDPATSSWRMSQGTLDLDSTPSSVTLPKQGLMRNGVLYAHPTSARATGESGCSLLPTPAANDSGNTPENHLRKKPGRTKVTSLAVMARGRLLPTPMAGDSKSARNSTAKRNKIPPTGIHIGDTLTDAVWKQHRPDLAEAGRLLPTPWTSDSNGGGTHGDGGMDLRTTISLLPTPTSRDWKDGAGTTWHPEKCKLPHSIGAITSLLSDATNTTSDDPHPNPPTNEDD